MHPFRILGKAFFDGFTMAGFLSHLRYPGQAERMFAPTVNDVGEGWQQVSFRPSPVSAGLVVVAGSLHSVPEQTLHTMIDLLKREDEDRKTSRKISEGAAHGASR